MHIKNHYCRAAHAIGPNVCIYWLLLCYQGPQN